MSDFNIKITVRNARLLRAIREKYATASELARVSGVSKTAVAALVTMRAQPFLQDGSLSSAAEGIVSALGVPADDLWPNHIARLKAKRAQIEIEMDADQFAAIASDDPEKTTIYRQAISRWSRQLTDRERTALAIHHSGGTLDDVGKAVGCVSRERARQIVVRAERRIREKARLDGVRAWGDIA